MVRSLETTDQASERSLTNPMARTMMQGMMLVLFCGTALAVTKSRHVRRDRHVRHAAKKPVETIDNYGNNDLALEWRIHRFGLHLTGGKGVEITAADKKGKIQKGWIKDGLCKYGWRY